MKLLSQFNYLHLSLVSVILTISLILKYQGSLLAWLLIPSYFVAITGLFLLLEKVSPVKTNFGFSGLLLLVVISNVSVQANIGINNVILFGAPYLFVKKLGKKTCQDIVIYLILILTSSKLLMCNLRIQELINVLDADFLNFIKVIITTSPLFITLYSLPKDISNEEIKEILARDHNLILKVEFTELIRLMGELRFFLVGEERGYYVFATKNLIINRGKVLVKVEHSKYRVVTEMPETLKEITQRHAGYLTRKEI